MRAYVAITPSGLQSFLEIGQFHAPKAFIVDSGDSGNIETNSDDQEELEFESSWEAAQVSRAMQNLPTALGLVLAVDLGAEQVGDIEGNQVSLLSDISWPQVQSLLLSESDEPELSWFAAQEIPTYLSQWLT